VLGLVVENAREEIAISSQVCVATRAPGVLTTNLGVGSSNLSGRAKILITFQRIISWCIAAPLPEILGWQPIGNHARQLRAIPL
jgi:hypothetical protein